MPDTYTSQFSGEEIDSALRAAQIISGASTLAELRKKLEIRGDTIPVSAEDSTLISDALKYRTNPNLLDNWYFGRPVNQRGQTEYSEYSYTIDRWIFDNDSGTVTANLTQEGVRFSASSETTGIASLRQIIDPENINALAGKTVTLSCLGKTDSYQQVLFYIDNKIVANASSASVDGVCMTTCTYTLPTVLSSFAVFLYARSASGAGEGSLLAAKLELGDTQTLAHKENEKWVLNEIPDFGEQLARCQRYCRPVPNKLDVCIVGETYYAYTEESFEEMRVAPVSLTNLVGKNVKNMTGNDVAAIINVYTWNRYGGVAIQLSQNPNTDIVFLDSMNYLISADL